MGVEEIDSQVNVMNSAGIQTKLSNSPIQATIHYSTETKPTENNTETL